MTRLINIDKRRDADRRLRRRRRRRAVHEDPHDGRFDLSRCLFDGLSKASTLLYGEEKRGALLQSTD